MSEPLAVEAGGGAAPLPQMLVLSYLTGTTTRARRVGSIVVLGLGILLGVSGLLCLLDLGQFVYRQVEEIAGWMRLGIGGPPAGPKIVTPDDVVWAFDMMRHRYSEEWYVMWVAGGCGLFLLIFARGVKRGNGFACRAAAICVGFVMVLVALLTVMWCGVVVYSFGWFFGHPDRLSPLYLVILPVGVVMVLILKDVIAILRWVGRNPLEEKPAVAFLRG